MRSVYSYGYASLDPRDGSCDPRRSGLGGAEHSVSHGGRSRRACHRSVWRSTCILGSHSGDRRVGDGWHGVPERVLHEFDLHAEPGDTADRPVQPREPRDDAIGPPRGRPPVRGQSDSSGGIPDGDGRQMALEARARVRLLLRATGPRLVLQSGHAGIRPAMARQSATILRLRFDALDRRDRNCVHRLAEAPGSGPTVLPDDTLQGTP